MSVTQYIGARYVPLFVGNWDINAEYEPLSIVYYMGNSYTSRQAVPTGVPIENEQYWALTGNYNAQVEQYRQEVRAFDGRISDNADAIADNSEAIEQNTGDITALGNRVTSETTTLNTRITTETTTLSNRITTETTALENDISAETAAREALAEDVKTMHLPISKHWYHIYIDGVNGNDTTGTGAKTKPFKTLDAAIAAKSIMNNNLSFYFLRPGTYTMDYSYFVGCVVHFRVDEDCPAGDIKIKRVADDRGLYFYDAHLNCGGTANNNMILEATDNLIRFEGSTLWANYTTINCSTLSLIQGGMSAGYCVFNCPINSFFSELLFTNSQFQNTYALPAVKLTCGSIRFTGVPGCKFARNPQGASAAAVEAANANISMNSYVGAQNGASNINYSKFFNLDACNIGCTDEWLENLDGLCAGSSTLGGITLRRRAGTAIPAQ